MSSARIASGPLFHSFSPRSPISFWMAGSCQIFRIRDFSASLITGVVLLFIFDRARASPSVRARLVFRAMGDPGSEAEALGLARHFVWRRFDLGKPHLLGRLSSLLDLSHASNDRQQREGDPRR